MRALDDAVRRARRVLLENGEELREARLAAGLRQADVGRALGWSASKVARIERGVDASLAVLDLARIAAVVGRELSLRLYPGRGRLRDAAQLDLEKRFLFAVEPGGWRPVLEEAVRLPADLRAFDLTLRGVVSIGVEFVTRLRDVQALARQVSQKQRDSRVDRVVLVVKDTNANRRAVREAAPILAVAFPMRHRGPMAALRGGRDPGGNALIFM